MGHMDILDTLISSSVTLIVGSFAIWLYLKNKWDEKRNAASILLLEIRSAERKIRTVKNLDSDDDGSNHNPIMKNESWSKYKYLFVKDLDRDEWDSVNDFYEKCALYDEAITNGAQSFPKNEEQIRINAHRIFADYISNALEDIAGAPDNEQREKILEIAKLKAEAFDEIYLKDNGGSNFISRPLYTPQKYADDRNKFIRLIDADISSKPAGQKLKKIAKIKP